MYHVYFSGSGIFLLGWYQKVQVIKYIFPICAFWIFIWWENYWPEKINYQFVSPLAANDIPCIVFCLRPPIFFKRSNMVKQQLANFRWPPTMFNQTPHWEFRYIWNFTFAFDLEFFSNNRVEERLQAVNTLENEFSIQNKKKHMDIYACLSLKSFWFSFFFWLLW